MTVMIERLRLCRVTLRMTREYSYITIPDGEGNLVLSMRSLKKLLEKSLSFLMRILFQQVNV